MQHDSLTASVHYGDYSGTVAADRHDQRDIDDLAMKNGIDTDRYFVFGLDLHIGERVGTRWPKRKFRSWPWIRRW